MASGNDTNKRSSPIINTNELITQFIGWGVSTLMMVLLNRNDNSGDSQEPDKYRDSTVNQIGSAIPVVLGRAMIKDPLISYYGDFGYDTYTEEYGMHSNLYVKEILWPLVAGILVILLTPNKVITTGGAGTETTQGKKNQMIVQLIINAFITFFLQLFTRHL